MYRVTPPKFKDLQNKDSGDGRGDMYFRFGDELYLPQLCKVLPGYDKCDGGTECNPVNNSSMFQCAPTECSGCDRTSTAVGMWNLSDVTWGPPTWIPSPFDMWKYNSNLLLGGLWWSTPTGGECAAGKRPGTNDNGGCTWRVVAKTHAVNASCADNRALAAIIAKNGSCFAACPRTFDSPSTKGGGILKTNAGKLTSEASATDHKSAGFKRIPYEVPYNTSTMCFLQCVFGTMFGSSDGTVINPGKAMAAEEIVDPWLSAFDDKTGCPQIGVA